MNARACWGACSEVLRRRSPLMGGNSDRRLAHDVNLYRDRNTVERAISKMKDWRGIATRYDKTPASYLAGLHLRVATIWITSLLAAD